MFVYVYICVSCETLIFMTTKKDLGRIWFATSKRQTKCSYLKLWVQDRSNFLCGYFTRLAFKVAINEIIYGNLILIELSNLNAFVLFFSQKIEITWLNPCRKCNQNTCTW